ncbi:hypothetical protein Q5Z34_17405 [Listeria innocua]
MIPAKTAVKVAGIRIVSTIQILAKKPEHATKGIIFAAMVETYAILGFVISFLLVLNA